MFSISCDFHAMLNVWRVTTCYTTGLNHVFGQWFLLVVVFARTPLRLVLLGKVQNVLKNEYSIGPKNKID